MSNGVVGLLPGTAVLLGGNLDVAPEIWLTNASVATNMFVGYGCSSLFIQLLYSPTESSLTFLSFLFLELHGQTSFISKLKKPFAADLPSLHRSTFK